MNESAKHRCEQMIGLAATVLLAWHDFVRPPMVVFQRHLEDIVLDTPHSSIHLPHLMISRPRI